jgi:pectinesterase
MRSLSCASVLVLLMTGVLSAAKPNPVSTPVSNPVLTVAADGSGQFKTIQEAVAAASGKTTIRVGAGDFRGPIVIPKDKPGISLIGEGPDKTFITWDRNVYEEIPPGSDKFNPGLQVRADDFRAENLTVRNISGDHGQALAVRIDSDRTILRNCRLLGWQDTLMVNNGRHYFKDCYIEGRVDFIYGSGTAIFDHCEVHSKNGGYVTAANTPEDHPFGFVFLDCKLTGDAVPWNPATTNPATTMKASAPDRRAYLGRPWRQFAAVAFIRCQMDDHIRPEGWHNWGKPPYEQTARYSEFGSTGPGGNMDKRVAWARRLTAEEAGAYTIANILGGPDHWDPTK